MSLVKWEKIASEIESAKDWDEILSLNDQVAAFQAWARQTKQSLETQNKIAEYRLRLERKKGHWLNANVPHGGDRGNQTTGGKIEALNLGSLNVSPYESFTARTIASIPEETFEREIAKRKECIEQAVSELTTAGMLRLARPDHVDYDNNNPFPLKLGELKPFLQQEAVEANKSLHFWIKKILQAYKAGRENLTLHNIS